MSNNNFQNLSKLNNKEPISTNINLTKITGITFIIFACIPWVNFGLNNYDSQPWSFILSVTFLLLISRKIILPENSILILFLVIIGLSVSIIFTVQLSSFSLIRAVIQYLTLPIMYIAFYNFFIRYKFPIKLFIFMNFLWIFFGFVEIYFYDFVKSITHVRTDDMRGVTSLAPEATFFGLYLFFSSWILLESNNLIIDRKIKLMLFINFLLVIFLAKSSMVILFYIIIFLIIFFRKFFYFLIGSNISIKNITTFLFYFVVIGIFFRFLYETLDGSRVEYLMNKLTLNRSFLEVMILDDSINSRAESLFFSIFGTLNNYLLPGGLDSFIEMRRFVLVQYNLSDIFFNKVESNKIMSWIGSILYELGILGLFLVIFIFKSIYKKFNGSLLYYGTLFLILLSAVPVAFPLVPMLFALIVYNKKTKT